jgi:hypothetical protein
MHFSHISKAKTSISNLIKPIPVVPFHFQIVSIDTCIGQNLVWYLLEIWEFVDNILSPILWDMRTKDIAPVSLLVSAIHGAAVAIDNHGRPSWREGLFARVDNVKTR